VISVSALPTGWTGRILALVLLAAALGAGYEVFVLPLLGLYADREVQLENRRMMAQHLAGVTAGLPALRSKLAALRATGNGIALEGASDAIASANLQSRIQEFAAPAGATISSTENLPADPRGAYHRIGVRVGLTGEYPAVMKLLAALETATPPLVIDNVRVLGGQGQAVQRAADSRLDASFEVYGFLNSKPSGQINH
jgi:general secretion pathway protein M